MQLITKSIMSALIANRGKENQKPVVKFFNPCGAGTWLISEIDEDGDTLFGLCDLGMGCPELGYVSLSELKGIKLRFGLGIERDLHWNGEKTLMEYLEMMEAGKHV